MNPRTEWSPPWRAVALIAFGTLMVVPARAQFNGFASASYGYHSDPLYNYETIPDQLRQGYLELQYAVPAGTGKLTAGYVAGLMVFNTFTDRNYLEHSGRISYQNAFGVPRPPPRKLPPDPDAEGEDAATEEDAEEAPVDPDSGRVYLNLQLRASARHDKVAFREFNNTGAGFTAVVRMPVGGFFLRVMNDVGMRSYANLPELSNLSEHLTLQVGRAARSGWIGGLMASGGFKYYTSELYDTTLYESTRTYVEKNSGKGKAGAKLIVPSEKKILVNAATTTSWQIAGGGFAGATWTGGSVGFDVLYRHTPGVGTRYLAQYVNSSMLTEDIYNDFFSYEGPEGRLVYRQTLPLGVQSILSCSIARHTFAAPALDINGVEIGGNRTDIHSVADLWISRYFDIGAGMGLDLAVSAGVTRNQSNDDYNDFGLWQVGLSAGVGF